MPQNTICRLCLFESPTTFSLFTNNAAKMLEALTSIRLSPNDELSAMCLKCSLNLRLAYNIQQRIIKADERFRKNFLTATTIKQELIPMKSEEIDESVIKLDQDLVHLSQCTCIICNVVLDDASVNAHIQQHFSNEQLCDLCNQTFCDIKSYRTHLLQHPEHSPHTCDKCDVTFRYKSLFNVHMESAHPKTPVKTSKKPKNDLIEELDKLHKKGFGAELAQMIAELSTENKINRKKMLAKDSSIPYKCNICLKEFTDKNKFRGHNHRRKECPVCKKLVTAQNFCNHVKNHNSGPQICEQCGKTYTNIDSLRGHMFYQHRGKHYECQECKIPFKNRQGLNSHRRRHHAGTAHICETCGRKFVFSYDLNKHIKITHLKLRPYVCDFCKKGFSGLHAMKTHRRQHTNETPYKCEVCGEGFRQNVSLKGHRKSKHNIVEAVTCKCEVCGKGFSSLHAVKSHMRCH